MFCVNVESQRFYDVNKFDFFIFFAVMLTMLMLAVTNDKILHKSFKNANVTKDQSSHYISQARNVTFFYRFIVDISN